MSFKPLLASPAEDIQFPVLASIKIDGIRAMMYDGNLMSRRLKLIPNRHIRHTIEELQLYHCDGEIVTYNNGKWDDFNTVQSKVMTEDGKPNFVWFMFDHFEFPDEPYTQRYANIPENKAPFAQKLPQHPIYNQMQLDTLEAASLRDGWEGLIVRSLTGTYKYGRSTAREGILLKVVRKQRAEAIIVGARERMHNANEATINVMGYMERTSHKDNKFGRGDLGSFECDWNGVRFTCGTGIDDQQRGEYWEKLEQLKGKTITFEYRGTGPNGAPRFPAFIGFRDERDFD